MTQFIDKTALVDEIENKIKKYTKRGEESDAKRDGYGMYWGGVLSCLNEIRTLCDTLEVKEVQEEPMSEDLEEAAWLQYDRNKPLMPPELDLHKELIDFFKAGVRWKEQNDSNLSEMLGRDNLDEMAEEYSSCTYLEEVLGEGDREVLKARLKSTFKAGAKWGMEQAEVKIKAQSIAVAHGCPKESLSNNLEEAAKKAGQKYFPNENNIWARPNYEAKKAECAFMEGAKWQKEQYQKTIELAEDHAYLAGQEKMINKACNWLADNYSKYIITNGLATIFSATIDFDTIRMIEDFKNYMKGE